MVKTKAQKSRSIKRETDIILCIRGEALAPGCEYEHYDVSLRLNHPSSQVIGLMVVFWIFQRNNAQHAAWPWKALGYSKSWPS